MSALIKRQKAAEIGAAPGAPASNPATAHSLDPREVLKREVTELRRQLHEAEEDAGARVAAARDDARQQAEAAFAKDEMARIEALRSGINTAVKHLDAEFDEVERLALVLCEAALEPVFGAAPQPHEAMARMISLHAATLRRDLIIAAEVSATDFPSPQLLQRLSSQLNGVAVSTSADLGAGSCRLRLHLGAMEFSVSDYWEDLRQRLRAAARRSQIR